MKGMLSGWNTLGSQRGRRLVGQDSPILHLVTRYRTHGLAITSMTQQLVTG